ncbi:hypothetical protein F4695_003021 [Rhizobium soli]|uniref:Uncharacterized protein n=1 Tax=Rhizobium soli TaxID=424798 RepID=A0A7X0JL67_9HYPH|nr:hypothetical protein [Rhizobium soli]MBB6509653.1 hypothetical protein [Rhizobium soli]
MFPKKLANPENCRAVLHAVDLLLLLAKFLYISAGATISGPSRNDRSEADLKDDPATQLADIARQLALLAEAAKALSQTPLVELSGQLLPAGREKPDEPKTPLPNSVN